MMLTHCKAKLAQSNQTITGHLLYDPKSAVSKFWLFIPDVQYVNVPEWADLTAYPLGKTSYIRNARVITQQTWRDVLATISLKTEADALPDPEETP